MLFARAWGSRRYLGPQEIGLPRRNIQRTWAMGVAGGQIFLALSVTTKFIYINNDTLELHQLHALVCRSLRIALYKYPPS